MKSFLTFSTVGVEVFNNSIVTKTGTFLNVPSGNASPIVFNLSAEYDGNNDNSR